MKKKFKKNYCEAKYSAPDLMDSRHEKKIVESYQDETSSEKDTQPAMLASAFLLVTISLLKPFDIKTDAFVLQWFAVVIGILFSAVNVMSWVNLIRATKELKNFVHFFIQKTVVICSVVILVVIGDSSLIVSTLAGFVSHLSLGIFLIFLLRMRTLAN